ncbi:MAG: transcription-repair coupling factor [Chloroflexi bacterium]|nr:transcription-repair coupling factor [Chloroflexota bacterium]
MTTDSTSIDLSGLLAKVRQAPAVSRMLEAISTRDATIIGVRDSAKPATIALIASEHDSATLVITSRDTRADELTEELRAWLGDAAQVLRFPERDVLPYERLASDPETIRDRLLALRAAAGDRRTVIVSSALALAQRTLPADAQNRALNLRIGQEMDVQDLLGHLSRMGYSVEPIVTLPGESSRRGGIVDIFSPAANDPVRVEFLGRQIESLRRFDPATQRSSGTIAETSIDPALEATSLDVSSLESLDYSRCTADVREQFEEDIANLKNGLDFRDREFYVPFLATSTLLDHLSPNALVLIDEEADIGQAVDEAVEDAERSRSELEEANELPAGLPEPLETWASLRGAIQDLPATIRLSRWTTGEHAPGELRLPFATTTTYGGQVRKLIDAIATHSSRNTVAIISQQAQRLAELASDEGLPATVSLSIPEDVPRLVIVQGSLSEGWKFEDDSVAIDLLTDSEIFGFTKQRRAPQRSRTNREAFLAELVPNSYVVHIDHGIARFSMLVRRTIDGTEREYLELHYAEGDKLYVPTDQLDRVSKYVGPSDREPRLTRLGSGDWQRSKRRVSKAVQVLAKDLLQLYSMREVVTGHAYQRDTPWQAELEASFPYVETPDQLAAIAAVKNDLESPRPMDRLVCGDVGYGKTEVAIRAAFKVVMEGKQAAILVPTTVLAQQHFRTFRERLAAFPTNVEVLSRFRSDADQQRIIEELALGKIDIIIGTHRLVQKDVRFKDLGLVVVDEEQRFGVAQKEHLKKMRQEVDVLTLSATPIPRTLYMALGEIRDMSTMETPPEQRLPIKTYVSEFDEHMVREAIIRETERGGQVYFVHNRVHNIEFIARKVREIVPEARVAIGHGQMDERELERTMADFTNGDIDVLVCTTIIESGLDIPNVNTIVINQADRLGLAQLYQLRGRVGRGAHRAYAYMLYDRRGRLTETAQQRLQTIFEATELGSGFQIAMRDLEIRGAGNLLGSEQSGFMASVGFELYVRLLSGAVERLRAIMRGEEPPPEDDAEIGINLPISAHIPAAYVPDVNMRLAVYQQLSAIDESAEIPLVEQELTDRFGKPPPVVQSLLFIAAIKALAISANVESIRSEGDVATIRLNDPDTATSDRLRATAPKGVQVGTAVLRLDLSEGWQDRLTDVLTQLAELRSDRRASSD